MSMTIRNALAGMSPVTREFIRRVEELHQRTDITGEQKIMAQTLLAQGLTPDQRAEVEAQTMRAALAVQFHDPKQGNRKRRRAMRSNKGR